MKIYKHCLPLVGLSIVFNILFINCGYKASSLESSFEQPPDADQASLQLSLSSITPQIDQSVEPTAASQASICQNRLNTYHTVQVRALSGGAPGVSLNKESTPCVLINNDILFSFAPYPGNPRIGVISFFADYDKVQIYRTSQVLEISNAHSVVELVLNLNLETALAGFLAGSGQFNVVNKSFSVIPVVAFGTLQAQFDTDSGGQYNNLNYLYSKDGAVLSLPYKLDLTALLGKISEDQIIELPFIVHSNHYTYRTAQGLHDRGIDYQYAILKVAVKIVNTAKVNSTTVNLN